MRINWLTMIPSILGVLNGALLQLHLYHFDSSQLYTLDQAATILVTAVGVVYHNRKGITQAQTPSPVDTGIATGAK